MLCGNFGVRGGGMSASTRIAMESFWEYVAFALNSIVFLLIGFEVHLATLLQNWIPILVAYGVVTMGRALMVYITCGALRLTSEAVPWRWAPVLTWGGLRGALPMVLVLSLPASLADRDLLISMTYGVALLSILVQGLSMSALLDRLKLTSDAE
jgi:CPA1 family monovalent cation:H+ antiporter